MTFPRSLRETAFPLVLLVSAFLMYCFSWVCDDAFISFRYAKNLASGLGLVYNPGFDLPIEGYSNFLWVLIAAVFEYFALASFNYLPLISGITGLFLLYRVYAVSRQHLDLSQLLSAALVLMLGLFPPFFIWGTSGLATMPFALFLFLIFEELLLKKDSSLFRASVYALVLVLLRAEGFAWACVCGVLAVIFRPSKFRLLLAYFLPVFLVLFAQVAFRYFYYGEFFPNTVSAKVGFSEALVLRGFDYVMVFLLTMLTPFFILLTIPFGVLARNRSFFLPVAAMGFAFYLYAVLVGGDFMSYGRFLIPSLPFQVLLIGMFIKELTRFGQIGKISILALIAINIVISFLPVLDVYFVPHSVRSRFHFRLNSRAFLDENQHFRFMKTNSNRWRVLGENVAEHSKEGETLIAGAIGNVGYFSGLNIYDRFGLVTKVERQESPQKRLRSPGHDTRISENYFLNFEPTYYTANLIAEAKLKKLLERKAKIPFPYAPFIYAIEAEFLDNKKRVLYLLKRMESREKYDRQWDSFLLGISKRNENPR